MASHILMRRVYDGGAVCTPYFCRIPTSSSSSSLDVERSENLLPPSPEKSPSVFASSFDGLLCLYYPDDDTFIVWNPSSNDFKALPDHDWGPTPCPRSRRFHKDRDRGGCSKSISYSACGLGFDYKSKDYKFIQFIRIEYSDTDLAGDSHSEVVKVAVYSLKNNSWKDKSVSWNKAFPGDEASSIYVFGDTDVSGRLYWNTRSYIVSFDLADEEFSTLPLPDLVVELPNVYRLSLMELHGALALAVYRSRGPHDMMFVYCVWEMGTWTRKSCYDFCASSVEKPMGFCRNYELFLLQGIDGKLLVYDYSVPELKKIHQIYDYPKTSSMELFPYVNNTLPNSMDDII